MRKATAVLSGAAGTGQSAVLVVAGVAISANLVLSLRRVSAFAIDCTTLTDLAAVLLAVVVVVGWIALFATIAHTQTPTNLDAVL